LWSSVLHDAAPGFAAEKHESGSQPASARSRRRPHS
jgi:hypothetical protein